MNEEFMASTLEEKVSNDNDLLVSLYSLQTSPFPALFSLTHTHTNTHIHIFDWEHAVNLLHVV